MPTSSTAAVIQQPQKPDATKKPGNFYRMNFCKYKTTTTTTTIVSETKKKPSSSPGAPSLATKLATFSIFFSTHSLSFTFVATSLSPVNYIYIFPTLKKSKQTSEIWIFLSFFFPPLQILHESFKDREREREREREIFQAGSKDTHTLRIIIIIIAANRQKHSTLA
jgi:hypothetical protein